MCNKNKTVKITKRHYFDHDEWWCGWFKCPNCNGIHITTGFKYCPDCGVKLKFTKGAMDIRNDFDDLYENEKWK